MIALLRTEIVSHNKKEGKSIRKHVYFSLSVSFAHNSVSIWPRKQLTSE